LQHGDEIISHFQTSSFEYLLTQRRWPPRSSSLVSNGGENMPHSLRVSRQARYRTIAERLIA
jgi:hypothetical protein